MTKTAHRPPSATGFDDLIDNLAVRIQAGEPVDVEAFVRDYPEHASELRRVLPAMQVLAGLPRSVEPGASATGEVPLGELGDYTLIREVGRGGMGVVYEAEQRSLRRRVALKVLPWAAAMDPKQLQRFKNEALAAASLKHDHIVSVYAVGCERGVHYYAMEFVEGQTLADVIRRASGREPDVGSEISATCDYHVGLTPRRSPDTAPVAALSTERSGPRGRQFYRRAAELIAQAADALEHAHSVGIVHRDIKPGNLLVDAAGKLYVSDFGLARFGPDAGLTMSGDLLGTLRYMAPEQAMARHGLADHRVDVYGLGCTLYELLTGKPTVRGDDKADILRQIAFEEPIAVRKLAKAVPSELETITLKCLAKNPNERYGTAGELAADLRRYLDDKPIKARRPTVRQRLARWGRRHPGLTAALSLTAGLLLAGAWAWNRDRIHAEAAVRAVAAEADELRDADRLPEAIAVARRAVDLLPRFGIDSGLRREVEERLIDLQLLSRLEEARLAEAATISGASSLNTHRPERLFRQAFLDYGYDLIGGDEPTVVEALRQRAVCTHVAAAILEWCRVTVDPATKERLGRMAEALDPGTHQFVSRLRWADAVSDVEGLKQLATEAEADLPPPAVLVGLGKALRYVSATAEAERLLRAGQECYPADFWVNFELGYVLHQMGTAQAGESIRFYSVALGIRPNSPMAYSNLGISLQNLNRQAEAEACHRLGIGSTL